MTMCPCTCNAVPQSFNYITDQLIDRAQCAAPPSFKAENIVRHVSPFLSLDALLFQSANQTKPASPFAEASQRLIVIINMHVYLSLINHGYEKLLN